MGLRDLFGGRKGSESGTSAGADNSGGKSSRRTCPYGHPVPRGAKMCEHRHYIG